MQVRYSLLILIVGLAARAAGGLVQMPGHPPWKVMCEQSALTVSGVAGRGVWVVHPDRMGTVTKPFRDGRIQGRCY